ncbi:MAG: UTP--glucose-1-phosphate uridylyltransferase GalU [Alphaproteobacteria bacterium]
MGKMVRKAVFPVAGLGTRVLPMTKVLPKEMLPLVDRPLLQNAVEEARAAGIEEFCFVSSRGKAMMEDHFDMHPELYAVLENRGKADALDHARRSEIASSLLTIVRQHQPLGLGHAIWCAKDFVGKDPFAILLPDDVVLADTPCLAQMMEQYDQRGGNMVAVVEVPREQTSKYGILDVGHDDGTLAEIKGLVEKPDPAVAPSTLSIIGRYILQPEIFELLETQERGAGGEIQLTDAMAKLIGTQPFHGVRYEGTRYDCGDKAGLIAANVAFALARDDLKDEVRNLLAPLFD